MFAGCSATSHSGTAKPKNNTEKTATLKGRVLDATGKPIEYVDVILYANVILDDENDVMRYGTRTNEKGEYQIEGISYGKYTVRFTAIGYEDTRILIDIKKNEEQLSIGLKDYIPE